jgi:non-specific serine/threonine protein kinase
LVTITGVPGIGKTRLALEVCTRLGSGQPGLDSLVVPLAEIAEAASIPAAVAAARQARLADKPASPTKRGAELLVLDNTEHLPGAAEQIGRLLAKAPDTPVLVTSVSPLGLPGEQVLRLGPLGSSRSDPNASHTAPADAEAGAAMRLFEQRARAVVVGYRLGKRDAAVVAELCELLDGLPLAIELAAARVATFRPAALLAHLRGPAGLDLLRHQHPGQVPDRHRTMRAALEWSVGLLDPSLRGVACALSVFAGNCTAAGVAAVARLADESAALEALAELVDCHLVEALDGGRFTVLPLVRRFLRERLEAEGRVGEVEARHTEFVRGLGRAAGQEYERGNHAAAFALLEHEWPEVSMVSARLLDQRRTADGLSLAVDCAPYLLYIGFDPAAQSRLERLVEQGRRDVPGSPVLTRALLWSAVLTRLMTDARFDASWVRARLAEGMARARAAEDDDALLLGMEFTALSATVTGDIAGASAAVAEGIERTRGRDEGRLARFEALACMLAHQRGDLTAAGQYGRDAIARALRRGDSKATLLAAIAVLGLPQSAAEPAVGLLPGIDELVRLAQEIRDRHSESFLLAAEASRRLVAGDDAGAARASTEHLALLLARGESDTVGLGFSISALVVVAARRYDHARAAELYGSIERLDGAVALTSTPAKRDAYKQALTATRAALGPHQWDSRRRAGATRTSREAASAGIDYARQVVTDRSTGGTGAPPAVPLRPRELQVLQALAAGQSNKQIAAELGLTPKTVMHYVAEIYRKLGISGRAAATAWAARHGLLADEG